MNTKNERRLLAATMTAFALCSSMSACILFGAACGVVDVLAGGAR